MHAGIGLVRGHVVLEVVGLHDGVAGRSRAEGRGADDLGGARLEAAVEGEEPHPRRQHLLLEHVGMGEEIRESHGATVPTGPHAQAAPHPPLCNIRAHAVASPRR